MNERNNRGGERERERDDGGDRGEWIFPFFLLLVFWLARFNKEAETHSIQKG